MIQDELFFKVSSLKKFRKFKLEAGLAAVLVADVGEEEQALEYAIFNWKELLVKDTEYSVSYLIERIEELGSSFILKSALAAALVSASTNDEVFKAFSDAVFEGFFGADEAVAGVLKAFQLRNILYSKDLKRLLDAIPARWWMKADMNRLAVWNIVSHPVMELMWRLVKNIVSNPPFPHFQTCF